MSPHPSPLRPRSLVLVAAALVALPSAAAAQLPTRDQLVGSRVRVHAAALEDVPITGTVETVRDGQIVLRLGRGSERVVLPAATLARLEVAHPRPTLRRNVIMGGALGALGGAGLYLSFCYADHNTCPRDARGRSRMEIRPSTAGALAAVGGALVGGAIAYALTPQRWQSVSLGVAPAAGGGVMVGARIGQ
ncbi:MAG TPA: hypothetical protein VFX39_02210 [Gemmatimonadaceae bacterium]|nr:hypothetical protein [Gemmatimonadaceae bacterium]